MAPADDVDLVGQVVAGSHDALAGLYDRYSGPVFAAALWVSRDRGIAAEVVQETFLALWNRAEQFDPARGGLSTWLTRIARNRAIDHLRAAGRRDRIATFSSFERDDEGEHSIVEWITASGELVAAGGREPSPETALSSKETLAAIEDAIGGLGPLERRVIALAYECGLSQSEIATRLDWPIGTVKTRTRRALRQLRARMERPSGVGTPAPGAWADGAGGASLRSADAPAVARDSRRAWAPHVAREARRAWAPAAANCATAASRLACCTE